MAGNEQIERIIEESLTEMRKHIDRLAPQDLKLEHYTITNFCVTNLRRINSTTEIADIEAEIYKRDATYTYTEVEKEKGEDGREYDKVVKEHTDLNKFTTIDDYFSNAIEGSLRKDELSCAQKAFFLLQLKENLAKNYKNTNLPVLSALNYFIKDLYTELSKQAKKETNYFPVGRNQLAGVDPLLSNVNTIKITNLLNGIFLNEKNYAKLQKHEEQGGFERNEPVTIKMERKIVYE